MTDRPTPEQEEMISVSRDLLTRADSYLSLLWYRGGSSRNRDDTSFRLEVEETIHQLREAYK